MESQAAASAAFVIVGLLFLASTPVQSAVHAKYSGDTMVRETQEGWNITCEVPSTASISWKRNGQMLAELSDGTMSVEPPQSIGNGFKSSTLRSRTTEPKHEGAYTCVDGSNETHHFSIIYDVTIMVLAVNDTLVLECPEHTGDVEWIKDNAPMKLESNQANLNKKDGSLILSYIGGDVNSVKPLYGNYSCKAGNVSFDYRVVRKPVVSVTDSMNVIEGEKLHLTCTVRTGDHGLKLLWNFKNKSYTNGEGRVKLARDEEKQQNNAVLTLENIQMDDRGNITCVGYYNPIDLQNKNHIGEDSSFLRVKDKYAALWPFLGICAEVAILCIVIVIYEKKRNKSELEESDTDQSPDTKPTPNKDSDVRQRK